ncbi:MAG TPA: MATE family efflux transporter [Lentisphaeria bacterium]|nr:MATE family efflux transporter [Lentisphaeria bacterium]HCG50623.1 MATE family efflux transporter [Lentisphaeria bacterium]
MTTSKYQIDMCHGPLFGKIVLFAMPLMFTYILQLLFNAVDLVVIGHYAPHEAMAAVGATMNLNSLVINIFIGISIGTNVLAARFFGAKDSGGMSRTVHTSMTVAIYGGIALMIAGLAVARPLLVLMDTPEEILPMSCTYIWICFCAIPFIMLYNFGCAILRAVGDTRRPLYFLIIAGIVNVLLNLFFVIVCGMDVGGVALATAISHGISAFLILKTLISARDVYRLQLKKLSVDFTIFKEMLKIGIPAGVQSSCFAVSNMIIQSSINSFGSLAMAGTTAVLGLEGIVYVGSYAFHQTAISFVAQNLGGRKFKRILKSLYGCFLCAAGCCLIMGLGFYFAGEFLLAVFNPDPNVIAWGMLRMKILFTTYVLCGIMDVASGGLRGLGYSLLSAVVSFLGACAFRVWWVFAVFPHYRTMENLMLSYPISWLLVAVVSGGLLYWICRRMIRSHCARSVAWSKLGPGVPRGFRYLGGPK